MCRTLVLAAAALLTVVLPACDSVTPVAAEGTVLTVSISPTFISLTGSARVTVVAREASGQPVNPGVEVFFATSLGIIERTAVTNDSGVAEAILRGDGRAGEAVVTVTSGAAAAVISDPIQIGAFAALISLQVTPTVVLEDGGTLDLLALVRDDRGALLSEAVVNFGSEFGVLESGGSAIITDENGEARDTLTVSPADVITAGDSFSVTATTSSQAGAEILSTFTVSVTRLEPIASFNFTFLGSREYAFSNASTGAEPLSFSWDFGDGFQSSERNPRHLYAVEFSGQSVTVRLEVSNDFGSDTAVATIVVQE